MAQNVRVPPLTVAPSTVVGGTPTDTFEFAFPFWDSADVIVKIDGVALDPSAYTVTGLFVQLDEEGDPLEVEGGYGSGTVTLDTPVTDCTVKIDRFIVGKRETVFSKSSPVPMTALNADLNKATARQQDLERRFAPLEDIALDAGALGQAVLDAEAAATAAVAAVAGKANILLDNAALDVGYTGSAPVIAGDWYKYKGANNLDFILNNEVPHESILNTLNLDPADEYWQFMDPVDEYFQKAADGVPEGETIRILGINPMDGTIDVTRGLEWDFGNPHLTPIPSPSGTIIRRVADGSSLFRMTRAVGAEVRGTRFKGPSIFETAHPLPAADYDASGTRLTPVPWAPANYGWVFEAEGTAGEIEILDCYAPGVRKLCNTVASGRTNIINFKGFVFETVKKAHRAFDRDRTIRIHRWPYLFGNANVYDWMEANGNEYDLYRVDTPYFDDVFAFGGGTFMRCNQVEWGPYGGPWVTGADYAAFVTDSNPFPALAPTPVLAACNGSRTSFPLEGDSSLPGVSGVFVAVVDPGGPPPLHSGFDVYLVPSVGDPTLLVENVDYTVTLNVDQVASPGGTITTAVAYASGNSIEIDPVGPKEGEAHPFSTTNLTVGEVYAESCKKSLVINSVNFSMKAALWDHVGDFNGRNVPVVGGNTIEANANGSKMQFGCLKSHRIDASPVVGAGAGVEISIGVPFFDDVNRGLSMDPIINLTGAGSVVRFGTEPIVRNAYGASLGVSVSPVQLNNVVDQASRWIVNGATAAGTTYLQVDSTEANADGAISAKGTGDLLFAGGGADMQLQDGGLRINQTAVVIGYAVFNDASKNWPAPMVDGEEQAFDLQVDGTDDTWVLESFRHRGIDGAGWREGAHYYNGGTPGLWTVSLINETGSTSSDLAAGGIIATFKKLAG